MRLALLILAVAAMTGSLGWAQEVGGPSVEQQVADLLALPAGEVPRLGEVQGLWPVIRFSPDLQRFLRIRGRGNYEYKTAVCAGATPGPRNEGVPEGDLLPAWYHDLGMAGVAWRKDREAILLRIPERWQGDANPQFVANRTGVWLATFDPPKGGLTLQQLPLPDGNVLYTAVSRGPDGNTLLIGFRQAGDGNTCGIVLWDKDANRVETVYKGGDSTIYHLALSGNGKHLAWVEAHLGPEGRFAADLVVMSALPGKVRHRTPLAPIYSCLAAWQEYQPPFWTTDANALCYGDFVKVPDEWGVEYSRREVRLLNMDSNAVRAIAQDAWGVGATRHGIILNRGPRCVASIDGVADESDFPDFPKSNDIFLSPYAKPESLELLVGNAFAQQVIGDQVIYAQGNGDNIAIKRTTLKAIRTAASRPAKTQ